MSFAEGSLKSISGWRSAGAALRRLVGSVRLWVYVGCSISALITSYLFGKDVMWDTLAYHLYAGFSALHDRFSQDYFAAGTQSYFNPYIYVPYYLIVKSGLSALGVSLTLAFLQSGLLWLTFEIALLVNPLRRPSSRIILAVAAVALAFANPILINQVGTSYVDILTAEIVLAGWLLLLQAVRAPALGLVVAAGFMLGAVSGLKLTNAVHAVAACAILPFLPLGLSSRARYAGFFCVAGALGCLLVMVPWSIHLERHFGSPLFPLFNGLFHAPQFPAASLQDQRFIPDSLWEALRRPFAIAAPVTMSDDEFAAPDLRYVVLLSLGFIALLRWAWGRYASGRSVGGRVEGGWMGREFAALGCAFVLDWALWLAASGNGRYFIAAACIAAVLVIGLTFRLSDARPKWGAYLLVAMFCAQVFELCAGATYRAYVPWDGGRPFELSIPRKLTEQPDLYLTMGEESMSFLAPFMSPKSGFVDLEGDYVIGPNGASGAHLESLIRRYAPHVRVLVLDPRLGSRPRSDLPDAEHVNDTLAHFGLRALTGDCMTVVFRNVRQPFIDVPASSLPIHVSQLHGEIRVPVSPDRSLVTCKVVGDRSPHAALFSGDQRADVVFDRVEDACPRLFRPRRPVTEDFGGAGTEYHWLRRYDSTGLALMIAHGAVELFDPIRGGPPTFLGLETAWESTPPQLDCGRRHEHYYVKVVSRHAGA